jgi:hypothetical protein
MRNYLLN